MSEFLQKIRSKSATFGELFLFATILILLPIQFPHLLTSTNLTFRHWFHVSETTLQPILVWAFFADILIILFSLWTIHRWKGLLTNISSLSFLLFLGVASATLYNSPLPAGGGFYKLFSIFILFCLFHVVATVLREDGEKKIHFFFLVILMMMVFEGVVATQQYFTQALIGLGKFEPYPLSISEFPMPSGQLWAIDSLLSINRSFTSILRPYGTLTHANTLGGFLFFCSFISFYFFFYVNKTFLEILLALLIFFHFFSLCLTFSRAAIFGYLIMSIFWFFLFALKIKRTKEETRKLWRLAIYVLASVTICFSLFYPQFTHRGGIVNYNAFVSISSDTVRVQSNYTAWKMFLNHFYSGVGLEQYSNYILPTIAQMGTKFVGENIIVHNLYLLIAAETGFFGIFTFLLFTTTILWKSLRNLNPLTLTLATTFAGFLLLGMVDFYLWRHPAGRMMFFMTAGFISVLCEKRVKKSEPVLTRVLS